MEILYSPRSEMASQARLLLPGCIPEGNDVRVDLEHPLAPPICVIGDNMIGYGRGYASAYDNLWVDNDRIVIDYTGTTNNNGEQSLSLPTHPDFNRPFDIDGATWSFRLECWGDLRGGPFLLYEEGGASNGFGIYYRTGGNYFSACTAADTVDAENPMYTDMGSYESAGPFELTLVYDPVSDLFRWYIDGAWRKNETATFGTLYASSSGAALGGRDGGLDHLANGSRPGSNSAFTTPVYSWHGVIYDFMRWPRALSADEIAEIHSDRYQFLTLT